MRTAREGSSFPEIRPKATWTTPTRIVSLGLAGAIAVGTALLMLPAATRTGAAASWNNALFTATSATCVTGLTTVDTATYWSPFGQAVILVLIQIGGFGIMTLGSLLAVALVRRLGLRTKLVTVSATRAEGIGELRRVLVGVALATFVIETVVAIVLTVRWMTAYGMDLPNALWHGVFHSVSSFNNAGFALQTNSLMPFVGDWWICLPICCAIILGGLGFPVVLQIWRHFHVPYRWSLTAKMVLVGTAGLLVLSTVAFALLEWGNPGTLGPLATDQKVLASFTTAVMPRTAGFNSIDTAAMHQVSWLLTDILMFIGAGPAGTAGGVKITTVLVLLFVAFNEVRGNAEVHAFSRRISRSVQREAITVLVVAGLAVLTCLVAFMLIAPFDLDKSAFEVISAFGTVGLSTGITPQVPVAGQLILVLLMYIGRLGPVTLANALAHTSRTRLYELPEERPIIG